MNRILAAFILLSLLSLAARAAATYEEAASLYASKHYVEARKAAEELAKSGDARAMSMLGAIYQNGLGTAPDEKEALRWFNAAAAKGQRDAQFSLAMVYLNGSHGV